MNVQLIIGVSDGRDVATLVIHGAFLQADIDETVPLRFDGKMAEPMSHIYPSSVKNAYHPQQTFQSVS
jgi:hypothetical protein